MDKHPLMELVMKLYEPYYTCKEDRLLVMFHFFMIKHGFRVLDNIRQVTHEILYLDKNDQNSAYMWYTKNGERIAADHEIAACQETGKNHLYSIQLQLDGEQFLGEFIIDNYLKDQNSTYSSTTNSTGPPSTVIFNIDSFVEKAVDVIHKLDSFIEKKQSQGVYPHGDAQPGRG